MILVDPRVGSKELLPYLRQRAIVTDLSPLPFGDACFEGNGPGGRILIGVERKTTHDLLNCIDDARFAGHQRVGLRQMYKVAYLIVEGMWAPGGAGNQVGLLMESNTHGRSWGPLKYRTGRVMYEKLRRYLFSVAHAGIIVIQTYDLFHTAFDIGELHDYWFKPWNAHRSMQELHTDILPTLNAKPSLTLKWANAIDDVGTVKAHEAERLFRKPIALANSDEMDWMKIQGIGVSTAQKIVRQIQGVRL